MRGGIRIVCRNLLLWLMAIVLPGVSLTASFAPPLAHAAGDPIFEVIYSVPSATRTTKTTMVINSRLKISEDGIKDEAFGFFDLVLNTQLAKEEDGKDRWRISSVELANLAIERSYGPTNSKILGPEVAEFYNRNNELVTKLDFTDPKIDSPLALPIEAPCFVVRDNLQAAINDTVKKELKAYTYGADCTKEGFNVPGGTDSPLQAIAKSLSQNSIAPDNYSLEVKNPVVPKDRGTVFGWFASNNQLGGGDESNRIPVILSEKSKADGGTPKIVIPGDPNVGAAGRPELIFTLSHVTGTHTSYEALGTAIGGALGLAVPGGNITTALGAAIGGYLGFKSGTNVSWAIFPAKTAAGVAVPYLYIVGDNKGPNWVMLYTTSLSSEDPDISKDLVANLQMRDDSEAHPQNTSHQELYRYVNNEPPKLDDDSCADGVAYKTGPKAGEKSSPVKLTRLGTDSSNGISTLNNDCLNGESSGWASWWGVAVKVESPDPFGIKLEDCSITNIVGGGKDSLGSVFERLTKCTFEQIFIPVVDWVTKIIEYAAGISYYPVRTRENFA